MKLDDTQGRVAALDALTSITASVRDRRLVPSNQTPKRGRSLSQSDPVERGQRQVEQVRKRMGMQMDDRQFQSALVDSQVAIVDAGRRKKRPAEHVSTPMIIVAATKVLYTKDHTKWNYDVLMEIIEGPLLNARRLEEAFRVSKFGRRLMTFFQPLYRRFSDTKRTRVCERQPIRFALCAPTLTTRVDRLIENGLSLALLWSPRLCRLRTVCRFWPKTNY